MMKRRDYRGVAGDMPTMMKEVAGAVCEEEREMCFVCVQSENTERERGRLRRDDNGRRERRSEDYRRRRRLRP